MNGLVTLVVEDESAQREMLTAALREMGHEALSAPEPGTALELLAGRPVDVIITDLRMPGASGIDLLRTARDRYPGAAVVLLTAYGTVEEAVEAMKAGAADFIGKPVDLDRLESVLERIAEKQQLVREVRRLRERVGERFRFDNVIGSSGKMQEVLGMTARVAGTTATVLVTGESGTGKELVANLIHERSPRAHGPFVKVNCAALPETLLEAELFGHRRGSFTGAHADRIGRFEEADGGTIFLDEIGEIPPSVQAKLLRVLQEREIVRVGENGPRRVDVRIVAATNRDLEADVRERRFREDLYYRVNVVAVRLPALRERREDVPELAEHFIARFAARERKEVRGLTHEALEALRRYDFPGNVRELENLLERAVVLCRGEHITREDLPERVLSPREVLDRNPLDAGLALPEAVAEVEACMIDAALRRHGGVLARAARDLGISERVLRYKQSKRRDG